MDVAIERAKDVAERFRLTGDLGQFVREVSEASFELGRYSPLPRMAFCDALVKELSVVEHYFKQVLEE